MAEKFFDNFNEFLYNYYKRLHLKSMSVDQKNYLLDLKEKKKISKAEDAWIKEIFETNKNTGELVKDSDGNYIEKDLIPLSLETLSQSEIEKLYRAVMAGFRELANNKDLNQKNPLLAKNWDSFFGKSEFDNKPFYPYEPEGNASIVLKDFMDLFDKKSQKYSSKIAVQIREEYFHSDYPESDFVRDYKSKNFSDRFIERISKIIGRAKNDSELKDEPEIRDFQDGGKFSDLIENLDPNNQPINTNKLNQFLTGEMHHKVLGLVYSNNDILSAISETSGKALARQASSIKNDENFKKIEEVKKKSTIEDVEEPVISKIKKFIDETLVGKSVGKLWDRHARHVYTTPAKDIVSAIKKTGFKPTDGLGKLIENNDIAAGLTGPAADGWKEFVKAMKNVKSLQPNAFKDALRGGKYLNVVVQQVIKDAISSKKFDETKMILETLAVLRYTMITSEKWEEWNKTENQIDLYKGIKGMDSGFLKWFAIGSNFLVNRGMDAIFWSFQLIANATRQKGVKFGGKWAALGSDLKRLKGSEYKEDILQGYQKKRDDALRERDFLQAGTFVQNEISPKKIQRDEAEKKLKQRKKQIKQIESVYRKRIDDLIVVLNDVNQDLINTNTLKNLWESIVQGVQKPTNPKFLQDVENFANQLSAKEPEWYKRVKQVLDDTNDPKLRFQFGAKKMLNDYLKYDTDIGTLKTTFDSVKHASDNHTYLTWLRDQVKKLTDEIKDLEKQKEDLIAQPNGAIVNAIEIQNLDNQISGKNSDKTSAEQKIIMFEAQLKYEAAEENFKNKQKADDKRRADSLKSKQPDRDFDKNPATPMEKLTVADEKSQYEQVVELMGFWDHLIGDHSAVNDMMPWSSDKKSKIDKAKEYIKDRTGAKIRRYDNLVAQNAP